MFVFPLAQGYKSEPTQTESEPSLCQRFIGAPTIPEGGKKAVSQCSGSQLSGSCGLPIAKIHRQQKPASCPWKGSLMQTWTLANASREREAWKISSCLCMICDLDRIVSLDGSILLLHCLGTAVTEHLIRSAMWAFWDLVSPVQSQQATGVSQYLLCFLFNFLEV